MQSRCEPSSIWYELFMEQKTSVIIQEAIIAEQFNCQLSWLIRVAIKYRIPIPFYDFSPTTREQFCVDVFDSYVAFSGEYRKSQHNCRYHQRKIVCLQLYRDTSVISNRLLLATFKKDRLLRNWLHFQIIHQICVATSRRPAEIRKKIDLGLVNPMLMMFK